VIAVDSSALIATIADEPEGQVFRRILLDVACVIAWPTVLETFMVLLGRRTEHGLMFLNQWLERDNVRCRSFDSRLFREACHAFQVYGKRRDGGLNFGDCMSYALAKDEAIPLLYKGDDFAKTDIRAALP
jgi:ribonuclease VapC